MTTAEPNWSPFFDNAVKTLNKVRTLHDQFHRVHASEDEPRSGSSTGSVTANWFKTDVDRKLSSCEKILKTHHKILDRLVEIYG